MALEGRRDCDSGQAGSSVIWRRLARTQRKLRQAEDALEQAASAFAQLVYEFETGSAPLPADARRCPRREVQPLPVASGLSAAGPGPVTFTVHGVEFRVDVSGVRRDLIALLASETTQRTDGLVGFKTVGSLVQSLRARGFRATRRSVTVEVSRLRAALGQINRDLIENRKGSGYRLRLRSAAALGFPRPDS